MAYGPKIQTAIGQTVNEWPGPPPDEATYEPFGSLLSVYPLREGTTKSGLVLPNLQEVKDTSQVINTKRQIGRYLFQVLRIWYNCDKPKTP